MLDEKTSLKYIEFLSKSQFSRKIHPSYFLISNAPLKVLVGTYIVSLLLPDSISIIFSIGGILIARKYIKTRMSYRAPLSPWASGKEDESIMLISYYLKKKEDFLKSQRQHTKATSED